MKYENIAARSPHANENGFFTVEAMIAAAIFAIAVTAVLALISGSFKANDGARGITEQTAFAADLIERLYALPYEDNEGSRLDDGAYTLPDQGRYAISYTVQEDTPIANNKQISVTIQWNQGGMTKSITIDHIKPDTVY